MLIKSFLTKKQLSKIKAKLNKKNKNQSHIIKLKLDRRHKAILTFSNNCGRWVIDKVEIFRRRFLKWVAVLVFVFTAAFGVQTNPYEPPSLSNSLRPEMNQLWKVNKNNTEADSANVRIIKELKDSESISVRELCGIYGGDLGKGSSPGARAKGDARRANSRKESPTAQPKSGSSLFARAFSPSHPGRSRPTQGPGQWSHYLPSESNSPSTGGNFGRSSSARRGPTYYDPSGTSCGRGPRITINQSKNSNFDKEMRCHDGKKTTLTSPSKSHLTSRYGHEVGINDPLPPNPNQKPRKYPSVTTRTNYYNNEQFSDVVQEVIKSPDSKFFPNVNMRGIKGRGYVSTKYGEGYGFFVGIHEESEFKGQIKKAQSISKEQYDVLKQHDKLNG